MDSIQQKRFMKTVWDFYHKQGRHDLPWRQTTKPYRIVVSEIMLQQTQVERVLPKYRAFLRMWPTARRLAAAPLGEVLKVWQGLGYNRRAQLLHQCARMVADEYSGRWPQSYNQLQQLPGLGPYTAGAVMAFAYNEPVPFIETNIRTVFLHHFFTDKTNVPESDIVRLTELYLDQKHPREWYWALMDYGSYLKKTYGNQNRRAKSYIKQSKFAGSDRQIRGAIIRTLAEDKRTKRSLGRDLGEFDFNRISEQLSKLTIEGMVVRSGQYYLLPI